MNQSVKKIVMLSFMTGIIAIMLVVFVYLDSEGSKTESASRIQKSQQVQLEESSQSTAAKSERIKVEIIGGYETNPIDRGRPVLLIASALGVQEQVFRDAFSNVNPASGGIAPTRERERANKKVLLDALGKYGISNERLDEVSNYYRYRPQSNEIWKHEPAEVYAVVENNTVVSFVIRNSGSGYNSKPELRVQGFEELNLEAKLLFSQEFNSNGSIEMILIK